MNVSDAASPTPSAQLEPNHEFAPDGVRVEQLRAGEHSSAALFLLPGPNGDPEELRDVVSALTGPLGIYALSPLLRDTQQRPIESIERIAELMVDAIRRIQPTGPYQLGGYSFGALIALETARQLRRSGEIVEHVFLIEPVYGDRYWPRTIWVRALGRRTRRELGLVIRTRRGRVLRSAVADRAANEAAFRRARVAIARYEPSPLERCTTLIVASVDRHFGCDTAALWRPYGERTDVERVHADHVTIMQRPAATAVARVIDERLGGVRPVDATTLCPTPGFERPLIVTTVRWFSTARLAHALADAGFAVSTCRPRNHPLDFVAGLASETRLARLRPLQSLSNAIELGRPDIVIPDDERALALLRRLQARTQLTKPRVAELIARSVGDVDDGGRIASRSALIDVATDLGISAPPTRTVNTATSLQTWAAEWGLPLVLKTDGSWGGRGVSIVSDELGLRSAWTRLSKPPTLVRALKRAMLDSDASSLYESLTRKGRVVNVQRYVGGKEAIATVACNEGEVLALVCLEVVVASEAKGPAAVVRFIDHPGMAEAARLIVDRFRLSGFFGLDFIIAGSGEAQLVELNLRATPTCHLLVEPGIPRDRIVSLFPANLMRSPDTDTAYLLDLPMRAPSLVEAGERMARRAHRPTARLGRSLTRRFSPLGR